MLPFVHVLVALTLCSADADVVSASDAPRVPSLLGGATLGAGGSAVLVQAGFPSLRVVYAQGMGANADLGGGGELDWLASEIVAGGIARLSLARQGRIEVAAVGRLGAYVNLGAAWALADNREDYGGRMTLGVAASSSFAASALAFSVDVPATWTFERGGGAVVAPRAALAFETPLYGDLFMGAQVGLGWRAAYGGAPGAGGSRLQAELSAGVTYRLF